MRAGLLRERIDIQTNAPTETARGEKVDVWTTVHSNVPARVRPLMGREFYQAQQVNAEAVVEITIRYRSGISAKDRIIHDGTYYENVTPPANLDSRDAWLKLLCKVWS